MPTAEHQTRITVAVTELEAIATEAKDLAVRLAGVVAPTPVVPEHSVIERIQSLRRRTRVAMERHFEPRCAYTINVHEALLNVVLHNTSIGLLADRLTVNGLEQVSAALREVVADLRRADAGLPVGFRG